MMKSLHELSNELTAACEAAGLGFLIQKDEHGMVTPARATLSLQELKLATEFFGLHASMAAKLETAKTEVAKLKGDTRTAEQRAEQIAASWGFKPLPKVIIPDSETPEHSNLSGLARAIAAHTKRTK